MKDIGIKEIFKDYRRLFILICAVGLVQCDEPVVQYKRIYASQIGQSVEFDFDVSNTGNYQFSLLFSVAEAKENSDERKWQINLFGDKNNQGEKIPISLRLVKDGKLFSEERIDTFGTIGRDRFYRGHETNTVLVRNIKTLALSSGHYSATLSIISDTPNFDYVSTFAMMLDVSPSNLARVDKQKKATGERLNSDWYHYWRFVKWLVQGVYCVVFCVDSLNVFQPIDISQAGQSVKIDFDVNKEGRYQFALMFDKKAGDYEEIDRRLELFGWGNNKGVVIPVSFRLIKDGKVFYNRRINTAGASGNLYIQLEDKYIDSQMRNIIVLELPPGRYSAVMSVLDNVPEFIGIDSFFRVTYFNKK